MQTAIDQMEQMVEIGAATLFTYVQQVMDSLGERPFMEAGMSSQDKIDSYQAIRLTKDGLYHYADGIRMELDSRMSQYSAEERLALGLSDTEIRRIAYLLTLKYVSEMTKLSEKMGITIEGLELVPQPLPPMDAQLGGETWLDYSTALSTEPADLSLGSSLPSSSPLSPPSPLLPPPPLPPQPSSLSQQTTTFPTFPAP